MKPDGNERTQKKKIQKQIGIVVLCIVALFLLCMTEDFFRSSPSLDSKERFRSPTSEVQTPLAEDSAEVEGSAYSYGYSLSFYQDKVFFASEKLKGRLCFTEWKEPKKTHDTEVRAVHRFISKENLFYVVCRNSDIVVYDAEKDKILAKENLFNQLGTYYDVHLNGVDETGAYFSFITRGDSYIVRITPQGEFETVRTFEGQNTYLLLVDKGRLVYTYFHNEDDEEGTVVEDMQSHEKKKLNDLCTLTSGSGYPEALLWKDCLVAGPRETEVRIIPLDGSEERVYQTWGAYRAIEGDTLYAHDRSGAIYALDLNTGRLKQTKKSFIDSGLYVHEGHIFINNVNMTEGRTCIFYENIDNLQWEPAG